MNAELTDGVAVAVTGLGWMTGHVGSVQSMIEDALNEAKEEVQITAFEITEGSSDLFQILKKLLLKGVRITLVVNQISGQPSKIQAVLKRMSDEHPHFALFSFEPVHYGERLHAKVIVIDRAAAILGSPNLTWKGLFLNHEMAVSVRGPHAGEIAHLIDRLTRDVRSKRVGT